MPFRLINVFMLSLWLAINSFATATKMGAINEIAGVWQTGDSLWLATHSGLVLYSFENKEVVAKYDDLLELPDLELSTITGMSDGTIWLGSKKGYLYKKNSRDRWKLYEDFLGAGATPNVIYAYKDILIIGHDRGISLFDPQKERIISSMAKSPVSGRVFSLLIHNDTLYAGVEKNIVTLANVSKQLSGFSFSESSNWSVVDTLALEVRDLLIVNSAVRGFIRPAKMVNGHLFYGDAQFTIKTSDEKIDTTFTELFVEELNDSIVNRTEFRSRISDIFTDNTNSLWLSFKSDYIYKEPFSIEDRIEIPGAVFAQYQQMLLSKRNDIWLLTTTEHEDAENVWFKGAARYDGQNYTHFNYETYGFGPVANDSATALCESSDGKIWIGNNGGAVKMWNPEDRSWSRYLPFDDYFSSEPGYLSIVRDGASDEWRKCDAIVQDSMGYMWFAMWGNSSNNAGTTHRFTVVNPETNDVRFLFSRKDAKLNNLPYHFNIGAVDSKGNRFFYENATAKQIVIPSSIDPFNDSVEASFDTTTIRTKLISKAVASKTGGTILLATDEGVGIDRAKVERISSLDTWSNTFSSYKNNINAIAIEKSSVQKSIMNSEKDSGYTSINEYIDDLNLDTTADSIPYTKTYDTVYFYDGTIDRIDSVLHFSYDSVVTTVFWAAINGGGIERFTLNERLFSVSKKSTLNSGNRFYSDVEITRFDPPITISEMDGVEFRNKTKLEIDTDRNVLWIASETGLYSYSLGYSVSPDAPLENNENSRVFPNPYSKSKHSIITLDFLDPNVFIDFYTISGKRVAHFDKENSEYFTSTGGGQKFEWTIPQGWAPGTYMIAVKSSESGVTKLHKIIIIP